MTVIKTKHPRTMALDVIRPICAELTPLCEPGYLKVAGSLRRKKEFVGDVELVFVPRAIEIPDPADLFGKLVPGLATDAWLDECLAVGRLEKRLSVNDRPAWGPQNKLARHTASGIGIDLFFATRDNFWTLLVCRTGPKEFNARVCMEAEKRGQRWNPYRGFEDRLTGELLFVPRTEKALFDHFQWPYLEPWERA